MIAKRNTIQKQIVFDVLTKMHNHPSAGMVYEAVNAEYPNISRATVFRILAEAADEGKILRLKLNDSTDRYDTTTLRFYKNGQEVPLSSKENAMMKLFIDNVNRVFSKDMLYDLVWGASIIDENAIMVYINRLRQKIEDDPSNPKYIQTVRGLGYRFVV